jgi:lipoate-protein ligase A
MNQRTTPWRVLLVPPRSGAENMARDSGLMDRARETGEGVLSIYEWSRPTLSLGRNQTAAGKYDLRRIGELGLDVVRRPTGGRALLHHREVTYSVTAPADGGASLHETYSRINRLLLRGLAALGVSAEESGASASAVRPGILPCFALPAEGELTANGAKLVGSAQVRETGVFLQHGSILIEDDQAMIAEVVAGPSDGTSLPAAATLAGILGWSPSAREVAEKMFEALRELWDAEARPLDEAETAEYGSRYADRYVSELWTWRK